MSLQRHQKWIIRGCYLNLKSRLREADALYSRAPDPPPLLCATRAFKRYLACLRCCRADLPPGCTERRT